MRHFMAHNVAEIRGPLMLGAKIAVGPSTPIRTGGNQTVLSCPIGHLSVYYIKIAIEKKQEWSRTT